MILLPAKKITPSSLLHSADSQPLVAAARAKQTIVLSHDPLFLRRLWDNFSAKGAAKTLQIARMGDGRGVACWNGTAKAHTQSEYFRKDFVLSELLEQGPAVGDLRHVARCIRPLLEENLRLRFPRCFRKNEWLGDFIDKIGKASPGIPLATAQPTGYSRSLWLSTTIPRSTITAQILKAGSETNYGHRTRRVCKEDACLHR